MPRIVIVILIDHHHKHVDLINNSRKNLNIDHKVMWLSEVFHYFGAGWHGSFGNACYGF
jgi:hypothetical protein